MNKFKMMVMALSMAALFASMAMAQEVPRNEVSVQGMGVFTKDTERSGIVQHTTDSGGLIVDLRHHLNSWLAAEGSYGYSRNTLQSADLFGTSSVQSNMHQFTGELVVTSPHQIHGLSPFALAGAGAVKFDPTRNPGGFVFGADGQTKAAFVYGGGADLNFNNHLALRLEYRGLVYNRPDFGLDFLDSGAKTHTAEPSVGFVIRF